MKIKRHIIKLSCLIAGFFIAILIVSQQLLAAKNIEKSNQGIQESQLSVEQAQHLIKTSKDYVKLSQSIPDRIWKSLLSKEQYRILWKKGTEKPFTGELLKENREGVFVSAGCNIPVFKSEHKFKSGTGWPSYWDVFDKDNVILKDDSSWGMKRTEILSKCGEHLGHVFDDGPAPTGLRYCINSKALKFVLKEDFESKLNTN